MSSLSVLAASAQHPGDVRIWRIEDICDPPIDCRIGLIRTQSGSLRDDKRQQVQQLQARMLAEALASGLPMRFAGVSRSYAADFGLCALACLPTADERAIQIGADIELDPGAAQFSDAELCSVSDRLGLPFSAGSPRRDFFAAWTEYEARGKALGTGLTLTLVETRRLSSDYGLVNLTSLWERDPIHGATAPLYGALCLAAVDEVRWG